MNDIPVTFKDWLLGILVACAAWFGNRQYGRLNNLETRVGTLEALASTTTKLSDERHQSNLLRLERIDDKLDKIFTHVKNGKDKSE